METKTYKLEFDYMSDIVFEVTDNSLVYSHNDTVEHYNRLAGSNVFWGKDAFAVIQEQTDNDIKVVIANDLYAKCGDKAIWKEINNFVAILAFANCAVEYAESVFNDYELAMLRMAISTADEYVILALLKDKESNISALFSTKYLIHFNSFQKLSFDSNGNLISEVANYYREYKLSIVGTFAQEYGFDKTVLKYKLYPNGLVRTVTVRLSETEIKTYKFSRRGRTTSQTTKFNVTIGSITIYEKGRYYYVKTGDSLHKLFLYADTIESAIWRSFFSDLQIVVEKKDQSLLFFIENLIISINNRYFSVSSDTETTESRIQKLLDAIKVADINHFYKTVERFTFYRLIEQSRQAGKA